MAESLQTNSANTLFYKYLYLFNIDLTINHLIASGTLGEASVREWWWLGGISYVFVKQLMRCG